MKAEHLPNQKKTHQLQETNVYFSVNDHVNSNNRKLLVMTIVVRRGIIME